MRDAKRTVLREKLLYFCYRLVDGYFCAVILYKLCHMF
jgi:hypothetical protein